MARKKHDCAHILPLIDAYLDGELSDRQASRVRAHLNTCGACRTEMEETQRVMALLEQSREEVAVPPTLCARVMQSVKEQPRTQGTPARRPLLLRRGLSTALVLVLIVTAVLAMPRLLSGNKALSDSAPNASAPSYGPSGGATPPLEDAPPNDSNIPEASAPEGNVGEGNKPNGSFDAPAEGGEPEEPFPGEERSYYLTRVSGAPASTTLLGRLDGEWQGTDLYLSVNAADRSATLRLNGRTCAADLSEQGENVLLMQLENGNRCRFRVQCEGDMLWLTMID